MAEKIVVTLSSFGETGDKPLILLRNSGIEFSINLTGRRLKEAEIVPLCSDATGLIAGVEPYTRETLQQLPVLKCISRAGVGISNIDLDWAQIQGIEIRNTPNVVVQPVVELTLAMILSLLRKLNLHTRLLNGGRWEKHVGSNLFGKIVGVVGTGRIGKRVCETLQSLGAKVIAYDISVDRKWAAQCAIEFVDFKEVLTHSDILSLHVSSKAGDDVVLGEAEFAQMKHGMIVINTARGNLIDESALCRSLENGTVSGVGLDVFLEEPYHGPLTQFDDVVLTPHVGTLTAESRLQMEVEAARNLLDALANY